jgi:hypothetical protein
MKSVRRLQSCKRYTRMRRMDKAVELMMKIEAMNKPDFSADVPTEVVVGSLDQNRRSRQILTKKINLEAVLYRSFTHPSCSYMKRS